MAGFIRGLFGKRGRSPSDPPQSSDAPRVQRVDDFPWRGDPAYVAINFAVGDLINNLPLKLTIDGRIHAETLIAASGAIAGFAAQRALFARLAANPADPDAAEMHLVKTTGGDQFFFGEPLNQALTASSPDEHLWPLAAGAATTMGMRPAEEPDVGSFFAHVASTIGGDEEGTCSIAKYRYQLPAKQLLKSVWPLALSCFNSELSGKVLRPVVIVPQRWRPVVAARAAHNFLKQVAGVLPPLDALTVMMETAIYASKLDPAAIEPS